MLISYPVLCSGYIEVLISAINLHLGRTMIYHTMHAYLRQKGEKEVTA
jgi:hypothetical protein